MSLRRTSLLFTLAIAGVLPFRAAAEDDLILGRRQRPDLLTLSPITGSLGLEGIYSTQNVNNRGQSASASNILMAERLTLNTHGNVVSNNFMSWRASGTVSLEEQYSRSSGQNDGETGVFDAYDFNTQILKNTAVPITGYATRSENYIDRAFASLLRSTNTSYGGTIRYASPALPTTLSIDHTSITQSDLNGNTQYQSDTDQIAFETAFEPLERHQISLNASYADTTQSNPGVVENAGILNNNVNVASTNTESETAAASHTWGIDTDDRFFLNQGVSYSRQTGLYPTSDFTTTQGLRAHWTEDLSSSLDYNLQKQTNNTTDNLNQSITGNITHRLFASLTSSLQAGATFNDTTYSGLNSSTSSANSYFTSLGESYTKKLWLGRLGANLGIGFNQSDNSAISATQQITGDSQTFSDPRPIILTRPGIDPATVAVYDSTGTRRYIEGLDYTVRQVGNTVQIDRIVGGNIDADQTVRLNYDLAPIDAYTSDTTTFNTGLNYYVEEGPLKGLNPYIRYFRVDQSISQSGTSNITPDNVEDTTAGSDYNIWKLTLNSEYQNHQSTLSPYNAVRFSARYSDTLGDRTTLSLDASQNFLHYGNNGSDLSLTSAGGQITYQIMRNLTSHLSVRWRNENDSIQGTTVGWEEQARIDYRIRETSIYIAVRHTNLDTGSNSNESAFFQFGISRTF